MIHETDKNNRTSSIFDFFISFLIRMSQALRWLRSKISFVSLRKFRPMKRIFLILLSGLALSSCLKRPDYHIDISYTGDELRFIQCPIGGIGTGNILINGYGAISEFEIFNRADMDELPPYMTFFALYAEQEGTDPVVRVLERENLNEYPNPFGRPRQQLGGLPRFREAVFHNAYPLVSIDLIDDAVPLDVQMSAWSPFIPVDPEASGLPCAVIEWKLRNPAKLPVDYSLAFSMGNPLHAKDRQGNKSQMGCIIRPVMGHDWKGLEFSSPEKDSLLPDAGQIRVSMPASGTLSSPHYSGGWWDDAHIFWEDFSSDGKLEARADTMITSSWRGDGGAMFLSGRLEPGEEIRIPFVFSWNIPYRQLEGSQAFGNAEIEGAVVRNYYTKDFRGVDDISTCILEDLAGLREKTLLFSEAMSTSSIPEPVLDAAIFGLAALKTNLLMRDESGNVHAWEGLGNDFGCCAGNCTHVWNYAQTMAAVFPSLERNVRETGFGISTHNNGYQCFRTVFPLGEYWFKNVAADGQMGNIMRVYREWKMSGNSEWLGEIWPDVQRALEFAWIGPGELVEKFPWMKNCPVPWDPDKEGVLRGDQHNTYDINFFGPNMMTGSLYLGALKACSEMALEMNEPQKSLEYSELYKKGLEKYTELLWNGSYFTQKVEVIEGVEIPEQLMSPPDNNGNVIPKYQYGDGCLSDQLLGQYLAFISGMGYIMDTAMVQAALRSVFENNFREQMREFDNVQRIYAANDEPGLVICSWPDGNKPILPFVYADEVWTGIEYQVAASLIFAGMMDEGLRVTEAVRSRYQGNNRNPFAEIESGRYYARSLSSWSVYQAMAGYSYDGTRKRMQFSPAEDVLPFRFFWSTGSGWGTFKASRASVELTCLHGNLELDELLLGGKSFFVFREFELSKACDVSYADRILRIKFPGGLSLAEGEQFTMSLP
jgi:non-lysosomal glucosylceramidase